MPGAKTREGDGDVRVSQQEVSYIPDIESCLLPSGCVTASCSNRNPLHLSKGRTLVARARVHFCACRFHAVIWLMIWVKSTVRRESCELYLHERALEDILHLMIHSVVINPAGFLVQLCLQCWVLKTSICKEWGRSWCFVLSLSPVQVEPK
jgi:hypothetical protein